ncbi:MAG: hypothetical protein IKU60_04895 [Clostridia bacterium]|nr:hypothetical protein [Clostridia bacterium]
MKKFLCILMVLLLSFLLMSACGGNTENGNEPTEALPTEAAPSDEEIIDSIVGTWMGGEEGARLGYQFNSDGTGMAAIFPMTYTVEDGIITVTISAFGETQTGSGAYDVDGDTLSITNADGEAYVLTRVNEE